MKTFDKVRQGAPVILSLFSLRFDSVRCRRFFFNCMVSKKLRNQDNSIKLVFFTTTSSVEIRVIASGKSFGVICYDQKYYLTDSHSCGPKGARASNGKACVIECSTIDELVHLCKRSLQNVPYTLTCVAVTSIAIKNNNHTSIITPQSLESTKQVPRI